MLGGLVKNIFDAWALLLAIILYSFETFVETLFSKTLFSKPFNFDYDDLSLSLFLVFQK